MKFVPSVLPLRVQLLVVAVQTVDVTLSLGAGASHFKAHKSLVDISVEVLETLHTNVLQGVLDTGNQVRNELGDRAAVKHRSSNTLSDKNTVLLREVPGSSGVAGLAVLGARASLLVLHGSDTSHATVGLDKLTLIADKVFTRGLGGTGKKTTHHDGRGTHGKTLDDVTDILDTTVGNARNTEASSKGRNAAHGECLGTANCHDFLRNASTAATHANSQAIGTSSNQRCSLLSRNNVTANDVDLRVSLFDVLDHLKLEDTVTLATVQDDNVKSGIDKQLKSVLVFFTSANGSSTDQLLGLGKLGCQGIMEVLHQVASRQEGDKVSFGVHDWQLALLRRAKDIVGLGQSGTSRCRDEISSHNSGNRVIKLVVELDVTGCDHSDKLGAEGSVF